MLEYLMICRHRVKSGSLIQQQSFGVLGLTTLLVFAINLNAAF